MTRSTSPDTLRPTEVLSRAAENDDLPDSLTPFCQGPHQFLLDMALTGPATRFRMNDEAFLVLSDPTSIHRVMNGPLDDFEKGTLYEIPRTSLRDGVITVDGAAWTEQHKMLGPLFARQRIRQLEPFIAERVTHLMDTWAGAPENQSIDLLAAANRVAFDVVALGLLGITNETLAEGLFQTLCQLDRAESVRLNYLLKRYNADKQGGFGRSDHGRAIERLGDLCASVADERLARGPSSDDFLGAIMANDGFEAYPPERKRAFLADQVATMLSAGYVTTGESVFWALYLLAKHPDVQQRAREDIAAHTRAAEGVVPIDAPPYLMAAFNESHRLFPPVWFLGRVALRDVSIGDIDIAAGTRVICSPYVLHRMPSLWPQSDQYRPERFLPGATPPVAPRSLMPFGTGMRACLGRGLAMMEMSAIACMALARFDLDLVSDAPVALTATYSMHPRETVMFRLRARA